jgi:hypothetical protein
MVTLYKKTKNIHGKMLRTVSSIIMASSLLSAQTNSFSEEYRINPSENPPSINHTFRVEGGENFIGAMNAITDKAIYSIALGYDFHTSSHEVLKGFNVLYELTYKKGEQKQGSNCTKYDTGRQGIHIGDFVTLDIYLNGPVVFMNLKDNSSDFSSTIECPSKGSTKFVNTSFETKRGETFTGAVIHHTSLQ